MKVTRGGKEKNKKRQRGVLRDMFVDCVGGSLETRQSERTQGWPTVSGDGPGFPNDREWYETM